MPVLSESTISYVHGMATNTRSMLFERAHASLCQDVDKVTTGTAHWFRAGPFCERGPDCADTLAGSLLAQRLSPPAKSAITYIDQPRHQRRRTRGSSARPLHTVGWMPKSMLTLIFSASTCRQRHPTTPTKPSPSTTTSVSARSSFPIRPPSTYGTCSLARFAKRVWTPPWISF